MKPVAVKPAPAKPAAPATRAAKPAPAKPHAASHAKVHARPHPHVHHDYVDPAPAPARRGRRRRGGGGGGGMPKMHLTSTPTSRTAYVATREWLLAQHGPVCAYCGRRFTASVMTLDHVAPRRGQSAFDRRDNLVLACPGCNSAKRDLAPMAFLLGSRSRAANLVRYGAHLSPMLVDMARGLAPEAAAEMGAARVRETWDDEDDGPSPYAD